MRPKAQGKIFYGWYILVASIFLMGASFGLVYNCWSVFIKPVCEDLGASRQSVGMVQTLTSCVYVLFSFCSGKILMCVASVLLPASYAVYSFLPNIYLFYPVTVIVGFFYGCLGAVPLAYIINNWFEKKRGFAIGLAFAGSGLFAMIFSPLITFWIEALGWRMACRLVALSILILAAPNAFLVIRIRPEDKGLVAYGEEKKAAVQGHTDTDGITMAEAKRQPVFWLICLSAVLMAMAGAAVMQLPSPLLSDQGYATALVSVVVSAVMGALAAGKFLLGELYDLWGMCRATLLASISIIVGLSGLLLARYSFALVLIVLGTVLGSAFATVANPIIVRTLFGNKDYAAIYGMVAGSSSFGMALAPMINGWVYDTYGNYQPSIYILMVTTVILAVFYQRLFRKKHVA